MEENEQPSDDDSYVNESRKSYYIFMIASIGIVFGYFMM